MQEQATKCIFCDLPDDRFLQENKFAFAIRDGFPVSDLHSLVIPKRHVEDYLSLSEEEVLACNSLLQSLKQNILKTDDSVAGFNIGINSGFVAGQTIFHCHIHLIPRRKGDVAAPRGGVRHVIPGKGNY